MKVGADIADDLEHAGFAARGLSAVSWGVFASGLKIAMTIVVQAVLARLLGRSALGAFPLAILVMGVASYFADIGMATGLIQKPQISDDDIRFVFGINIALACSVMLIIALTNRWISNLFHKPELGWILVETSPVFLFNAMASVPTSLLRRKLDYRSIQLAGLIGYAFGFGVVGITIALMLKSAQALALAYVAQSILSWALLYSNTRHPIGIWRAHSEWRSHVTFGGTVLATNLVNWAAGALDRLVIGRFFSSAQLGTYSAAYNLIYAPANLLYPNLQSTIFSITARMQGDRPRQRRVYLDLVKGIIVVAFPGFFSASVIAKPLVHLIYGSGWTDSGYFAAVFCLMAPFLLLWGVSTPLLWNTGKRKAEAGLQLPLMALAAVAMILAAGISLKAVVLASATVFLLRVVIILSMVCRSLDISAIELMTVVVVAAIVPTVVLIATIAADWLAAAISTPDLLRVLLAGLVILATQTACLLAKPSLLPASLQSAIRSLQSRLPSWAGPFVARLSGAAP